MKREDKVLYIGSAFPKAHESIYKVVKAVSCTASCACSCPFKQMLLIFCEDSRPISFWSCSKDVILLE